MSERDEIRNQILPDSPDDEAFYANAAAQAAVAYRIRGRMIPLVGALTSLLFFLLVPFWYRSFIGIVPPTALLAVGLLPMIPAIPLHILGGNQGFLRRFPAIRAFCYVLCLLFNGVGTSLFLTAYYLHLGQEPDIGRMIAGFLISLGLYAIVCILIQIWPNRYGACTGSVSLLTVVLIAVSIVFWIVNNQKVLPSFCFFSLIWVLITVVSLHISCSDEESAWLRFSSFASFGILIVIGAVVLLILVCLGGDGCDCDCGDGCGDSCDCGGGTSGTASAKHRRRRRTRRM